MYSSVGYRSEGYFSSERYYSYFNSRAVGSVVFPFLIHGYLVNPRASFGLRKYTLIQSSAPRMLICGGECGDECARPAARVKIRDCGRGNWFGRKTEGEVQRKFRCVEWESNSSGGGTVDEVLSLLTDVINRETESVGSQEERSGKEANHWKKKLIRRNGIFDIEKEVRVDEGFGREESGLEERSLRRNSMCDGMIQSQAGHKLGTKIKLSGNGKDMPMHGSPDSRREEFIKSYSQEKPSKGDVVESPEMGSSLLGREDCLRDGIHVLRKGTSSSSYYSVASSDDLYSNAAEGFQSNPEKVGESSSNCENDARGMMDVSINEAENYQKCGSDSVGRFDEVLSRRNAKTQPWLEENRVKSEVMKDGSEWNLAEASMEQTGVMEYQGSDVQKLSKTESKSKMRIEMVSSTNSAHRARLQHADKNQLVAEQEVSCPQYMSNSSLKFTEEILASDVKMVDETRRQCSLKEHQITGQTELIKSSNNFTEMSNIHNTDIDLTYSPKVRTNSTSAQQARNQLSKNDQENLLDIESIRRYERLNRFSETSMSRPTREDTFPWVSKMRTEERKENSTSDLNKIHDAREEKSQADEIIITQLGSRKESLKHATRVESYGYDVETNSPSFHDQDDSEAEDHEERVMSVQESRGRLGIISELHNKKLSLMIPPSQSQFVAGGSSSRNQPNEEVSCGLSSYAFQEETNLVTLQEFDDRAQTNQMHGGPSKTVASEGTLEPTNQQQVLTSQELSLASEYTLQMPKETASLTPVDRNRQQSPTQISVGSGIKGPSDEMWDVTGPSSIESSGREVLKGSSVVSLVEPTVKTDAEKIIAKRSSRSLWNYIADLVRMSWGSHTESHNSIVNSGARTQSNESYKSISSFSGDEPNNNDEDTKKGKGGILKEHLPIAQTQLMSEASDQNAMQAESDSSASISLLETGSRSKGVSSFYEKENLKQVEEDRKWQDMSSRDGASTSSGHRISASKRGEMLDSKIAQMSKSGSTDTDAKTIRDKATEITETEEKGTQLKRRKFQRSEQVHREHFNRWEDALIMEHEQRKSDEMFMKEALLEAKRAADSWEVPVGAVLVHNGKIIARGCNLVEELRDSTAHAEMICIREGSNFLHTWRLAETTLYVTLEPCPMCAGAILQSRIDTLVWGAPNKLLGADGSWVSLFPGGEEERNGSDRPAGPVHPFHPKMKVRRGVLAAECSEAMQQFFQLRRKKTPGPSSHLPVSSHHSRFLSKLHKVFNLMFCL